MRRHRDGLTSDVEGRRGDGAVEEHVPVPSVTREVVGTVLRSVLLPPGIGAVGERRGREHRPGHHEERAGGDDDETDGRESPPVRACARSVHSLSSDRFPCVTTGDTRVRRMRIVWRGIGLLHRPKGHSLRSAFGPRNGPRRREPPGHAAVCHATRGSAERYRERVTPPLRCPCGSVVCRPT